MDWPLLLANHATMSTTYAKTWSNIFGLNTSSAGPFTRVQPFATKEKYFSAK
jgi:hypothetical protein